jgi:alpha-1,4-digalacturonate transport system permease protein
MQGLPAGLGRLAGLLFLPLKFILDLIGVPFAWLQRRFGLGGMAAAFLAPNMLIFGTFVLVPMALNIVYSTTSGANLFLADRPYVGPLNYQSLFTCEDFGNPQSCREDAFWQGVHNTVGFVISQVTLLVLTALATALVLNRKMRGRAFWRSVFFFPVLLSPVVVGLIWKWILQRDGLLNAFLLEFGLERTLWLADRQWAMVWAVIVSVWSHLGFYALILLAGLQAIPGDLYEAAEMDGTPRLRAFWRITLPLLWPNMLVVIVLALIKAVQVFDEVYILTGGGPGTSTQFLVQYIYETGFAAQLRNMGLASAASLVMGGVLVVLTVLQLGLSARKEKKEQAR